MLSLVPLFHHGCGGTARAAGTIRGFSRSKRSSYEELVILFTDLHSYCSSDPTRDQDPFTPMFQRVVITYVKLREGTPDVSRWARSTYEFARATRGPRMATFLTSWMAHLRKRPRLEAGRGVRASWQLATGTLPCNGYYKEGGAQTPDRCGP